MGPEGAELRRTVMRQAKEAEIKAAGMVLRAFGPGTTLEDLWVGDGTRFEFVRDESSLVIDFVRHEEKREEVVGYPNP